MDKYRFKETPKGVRILIDVLKYAVLVIACLIVIVPLVVVLLGSLKSHEDFLTSGAFELPKVVELANFKMSTIGMAENFAGSFLGKGIILRIDGGVSFLGDHRAPMQIVATAEDALRLGADSVITMSFPGSVHEAEVLSNLARVCLDCHKWGMPVTAEALPRGFEKAEDSRTPENITFAGRQAAELGADSVKTVYTGDPESFRTLTESVYAPVVILGGAKKVPERELLQEIRDALDAGASGVAMGRNIWGNEDPVRYAAAIQCSLKPK